MQAFVYFLLVGVITGLIGWINQSYLKEQWYWITKVRPYVLTAAAEAALKPGGPPFKECADCPEMVVIPKGEFMMGSAEGTGGVDERPRHSVNITKSFATSIYEVTYKQWSACASYGGCPAITGMGNHPVSAISWEDARQFVNWLSRITGKDYRLLSEARRASNRDSYRDHSIGLRVRGPSRRNNFMKSIFMYLPKPL